MSADSGRRLALLGIAVVSGAAALIYQVVWLRWFELLFGSTAYAASATLCAFFAGLALGAAGFGRVAARVRRPLLVYAAIEAGAAALALAVPLVFALYDGFYASLYAELAARRGLFVAVKFALAFAGMLPPAVLLGGTLPLLASAYVRRADALGREGGWLYAWNTLGAAGGSAAAAFWLPEAVGLRGSYASAIGLSLLAALGAALLARGAPAPPSAPPARGAERATAPAALRAVAFASGFGTLAFEVLLLHALSQILDQSVYSFGAVLVGVLLALAAGAALVAALPESVALRPLLGAVLVAAAVLCLAVPWQVAPHAALAAGGPARLAQGLAAAALYGGPALLVGSLVLPLCFRLAAGGAVGRRLGGLLAANTAGGILGSLAASFVLLDGLGLWGAFTAVGLGYAAAALAAWGSPRERALRAALLSVALAALLLGPARPGRLPVVHLAPGESLVDVDEGAHGVVSVVEGPHGLRMKLDNHYTLSGQGRLSALKERAGHLPLLLHPDPKRVLFVGSATGNTAGAAVLHPVEEIVLVEIVPEVHALAQRHFSAGNRGVHDDPRTRLVVEDGRNHLRATRERYDVVVADLFVPWRGAGSLYTREHFEAVRRHLTPNGVFCQWLPLYQLGRDDFLGVAATFLDVFPEATLWRGDFYGRSVPTAALIGFAGAPPAPDSVEARVRSLAAAGVEDRWVTDPRGFWMLYVGPLAALGAELERAPRNSDDHPHFQFRAGRTREQERNDFVRKQWHALVELASGPGAELLPLPFGRKGLDGARAGALLARVNGLVLDGRPPELGPALEALRMLVAPELLRPDPTAAEMWLARPAAPR